MPPATVAGKTTPDTALPDGTYPSICWECGTVCGSLVTVRDGKVTKVGPNPKHPASKGAFCVKGILGAPGWTYSDQRLLHPLKRKGERGEGKWERIEWDDALDLMADGLAEARKKHGPLALAGALLLRSLGSPNWMINQDLCGGCRAVSDRITGLRPGELRRAGLPDVHGQGRALLDDARAARPRSLTRLHGAAF
ncbi:MAG: molybdopterin-dependent oxidoreductase [Dehalococcoidia bacterium]|nr:molybdopterin-dependent oxidoreductase [Dehalococcoidia bacterium]